MNFLPYTLVAGAAFGCALLWVLVQWLRADETTDAVEREVQATIEKRLAESATAKPEPSAEELAVEAFEAKLASRLWWWGISGTVLGLVAGGLYSSFAGALLGGFVAPVLTTIGVIVVTKIGTRSTATAKRPALEMMSVQQMTPAAMAPAGGQAAPRTDAHRSSEH